MDAINVTYLELTVMFIKMHLARHSDMIAIFS